MPPTEPTANLSALEWALLIPVAFAFLSSGLLGAVLFVGWMGVVVARQGGMTLPALPASIKRRLPALPQPAQGSDQTLLTHLLAQPAPTSQPPAQAATGATVRLDSPQALAFKTWVNEAMGSPHLLIAGQTKSGKTTLVRALLHFARGHLLIIDPKTTPGKWGDVPGVGLDSSLGFSHITSACAEVQREVLRRLQAMQQGTTDYPQLTVVVDEFPWCVESVPTLADTFHRVGMIGRELRVRMIVLSQFTNVKDLGLKSGQSRDNYTWIVLGKFARRALPDYDWAGVTHPAVLLSEGERQPLATRPVPTYAALPIVAMPWQVTGAVTKPVVTSAGNNAVTACTSLVPLVTSVTEQAVTPEEHALITKLHTEGNSPSVIARQLPGYTPKRYAVFKAKVDAVLGNSGNDTPDEPPAPFLDYFSEGD